MFDFIAIGDTVTDDFIELKDAHVHVQVNEAARELCVRFGDKVPYERSVVVPAVGNAANAAVSATRLGLATAFVTDFGDDERGDTQLATLQKNGVDTRFVRRHAGMASNYHYVLRHGAERTILIKHHEYPYALPKNLEPPKWFYFSSVGEHGLPYHHDIAAYLAAHPESKLAFQPGTFQINLGVKEIKDVYAETDILFCNEDEAKRILKTDESDIKTLLAGVCALGPVVAVITDGPRGAYAFDSAKPDEAWFVPMYPDPTPPVDRTGAGDSFASTTVAALALGLPLREALAWGPVNSMSVVQYIGAQEGLLSRAALEKHLAAAPADYRVEKI